MKKGEQIKKGLKKSVNKNIKTPDSKKESKYTFSAKNKESKYTFSAKNIVFLFIISLIIFLSSLALSISFDYLFHADWFLSPKLGTMKITAIFIPTFWIIFLILFFSLSCYYCSKKERSYKIGFLSILLSNIILLILSATFLYTTGTNKEVDTYIGDNVPGFRNHLVEDDISRMIKLWENEEKGLLIGKITKKDSNNIEITDYNDKLWIILLNEQTNIKTRVNLIVGEKVKIIGEKESENIFKAKEIRPFIGDSKLNRLFGKVNDNFENRKI